VSRKREEFGKLSTPEASEKTKSLRAKREDLDLRLQDSARKKGRQYNTQYLFRKSMKKMKKALRWGEQGYIASRYKIIWSHALKQKYRGCERRDLG